MTMDKNVVENIRYKFELKKLIGDDNTSVNSEIRSDPWVEDLDLLTSTPNPDLQEDNIDNNISYSILYSKDTDEAKLIEENIDLYNDLVKIEEEERRAKQIHETEFENCKKELENLKDTDVKNKARIEGLTNENENLKRSISSLYRTVKREIEFKDDSLAKANGEIIRLKTKLNYINGEIDEACPTCGNINFKRDIDTSKRKRSKSPESSRKRENKSNTSRTYETHSEKNKYKTEKRPEQENTKQSHNSDLLNKKDKKDTFQQQTSKDLKHDKETQASNECVFCQTYENSNAAKNSKDPRKINDIFFNLLPDSLKKSFYEYEQDQVISLSKLKEAFIDEYFNSVPDTSSPVSESFPKELDNRSDMEQSISTKNSRSPSTSGFASTSRSEHCKKSESPRLRKKELNENEAKKYSSHKYVPKVPKNCYNSRKVNNDHATKKDLVSLFKYRKEKIPFTEKKKFGLHKEDKKLIPENLL